MNAGRVIFIVLVLSVAAFAKPANADLGFNCSGEPSYWQSGEYHPLSVAGFGVKSYQNDPIQITNCDRPYFVLKGEITEFDFQALEAFEKIYPRTLVRRVLGLDTLGGDLFAAIKIAKFARRKGMWTQAGRRCYSSCVIILAGGIERLSAPVNNIGIHRPYSISISEDLNARSAKIKLGEISKLLKMTFREFNVPQDLAVEMMSISPTDVRILSEKELTYYGLTGLDPVYETQLLNINAISKGISVQEQVRRKQISKTQCNDQTRWLVCMNNVMLSGDPLREDQALENLTAKAREDCKNFRTDSKDVDYEKYMHQRMEEAKCKGRIIKGG
jgi:hypothetical protein